MKEGKGNIKDGDAITNDNPKISSSGSVSSSSMNSSKESDDDIVG